MQLKVISSSSAGNCYLLYNESETLILECGVKAAHIKQALNFDLSKVVGILVTHEHQDHCRSAKEMMAAGLDIYASEGTIGCLKFKSHRLHAVETGKTFYLGGFKIKPFPAVHDCKEPFSFFIEHEETGRFVFITDSFYCHYTFQGLHNIIVETNFSQEILDRKLSEGATSDFLRNRVLQSHMSLDTCKEFLQSNDLSSVNNIVLIHLSDSNSDAAQFKREIEKSTQKTVHVATNDMVINFNKTPF